MARQPAVVVGEETVFYAVPAVAVATMVTKRRDIASALWAQRFVAAGLDPSNRNTERVFWASAPCVFTTTLLQDDEMDEAWGHYKRPVEFFHAPATWHEEYVNDTGDPQIKQTARRFDMTYRHVMNFNDAPSPVFGSTDIEQLKAYKSGPPTEGNVRTVLQSLAEDAGTRPKDNVMTTTFPLPGGSKLKRVITLGGVTWYIQPPRQPKSTVLGPRVVGVELWRETGGGDGSWYVDGKPALFVASAESIELSLRARYIMTRAAAEKVAASVADVFADHKPVALDVVSPGRPGVSKPVVHTVSWRFVSYVHRLLTTSWTSSGSSRLMCGRPDDVARRLLVKLAEGFSASGAWDDFFDGPLMAEVATDMMAVLEEHYPILNSVSST